LDNHITLNFIKPTIWIVGSSKGWFVIDYEWQFPQA
jgi:hypothetical protein